MVPLPLRYGFEEIFGTHAQILGTKGIMEPGLSKKKGIRNPNGAKNQIPSLGGIGGCNKSLSLL